MINAPAIFIGQCNNGWSTLEDTASGWHVDSKSAGSKWADCGEYISAGIMSLTGKTPLCSADYQRHMQYAMQADTGLAHGMYFVDSCCSKTIVKDVRHLKNITLLATPAKVAGLTGITEIQHKADLYMPVKDVRGKQTTIILKGVYYDPSIKYNLISVAELANVRYESRFGQHKSSIQGPAGIVPLVHTSNVYALEVMEQGRMMAMAAVNKMTAMEQTHLNFSHCISEKKLMQMSKAGVPGVPAGQLKNGRHTVTYDDGGSYEGALRDGKRHGYGTYTWSDGRRHIGEWFDDEEHGRGTLTGVSGYTRTGDWFGGKFKGA
jgi:hypothetical protein